MRLIAWIVLLGLASPAAAAPVSAKARAEARAHFAAGVAAFDRGDYDAAVDEYKASYDLSHAPALLFNLAQVYRLKKDYDQALGHYRAYLAAEPKAKNRADVEARIAEIEALQSEAAKPAPPPAEPVAPPVEPPVNLPLPLPPPVNVPVPLPVPAPAPAPSPRDDGRGMRTAGLITLGAGGLLAATTVVFLLEANNASSTITDDNAKGTVQWSADQSTYDRGQLFNTLGITTGIAAGAAVVTGGVLYYLGARREHVAPIPVAGGAGLVVTCDF